MTKNKKTMVIILCIAAIAAILLFAKADINHGHGPAGHATVQGAH